MKREFVKVLSCPHCAGNLELNEVRSDKENIIRGSLICLNCRLNFEIEDGIPAFGLKSSDEKERINEIRAENEWTISVNDIQEHIRFAKTSSKKGIELIEYAESFDEYHQQRKRVLDIGSGWGCFQAWQFAKRGYSVTATELCPEFVFASDKVVKDCYFERVITDCTVLPFKDQSFDIIFCKETLHHINDPSSLLDEIWRVCSPNGLIVIKEPCVSSYLQPFMAMIDRAGKIGITHHHCTPKQYIALMEKITHKFVVNHQRPNFIYNISISKSINKLMIPILGCNLEIFGVKRMEYKPNLPINRKVIPIKLTELNKAQIKFYRDELIPQVFKFYVKSQ
jgi:2-polyprenyl-3-methyl-5-hydroxy-6-metoxy-1,4-benzoquinol methylase